MPNITTFYSGPGKSFFASKGFQAEGQNGQINALLVEETVTRSTAMHGRVAETVKDQLMKITQTPFDNWGLLPVLFPTFLGVSTLGAGGGTGALVIGTRPHDAAAGSANGNAALKIWTPDGRIYPIVRGAITRHPSIKLGNGQPLYGAIEFTALGDVSKNPGASGFLITGNAITESGGSDPGGAMSLADFVSEVWTGAWGTTAGFGGDGGAAMQGEDFWELVTDIKYSPLPVQGCTRHMKLDSVGFMVKTRLVGPTHTQILGKILAHTLGQKLGAADLILTGQTTARTVTLQNAEIKGAGFEFGGTKLGTGEVGFVVRMGFNESTVPSGTAGKPDPILIFSA